MKNNSHAGKPNAGSPRAFRLTRFFSTTSFVGILVVTAGLFWVYRDFTVRHLIDHESRANADLTRAFANVVWDKYRPLVLGSRGRSRDSLLADPALAQLRADYAQLKQLRWGGFAGYDPWFANVNNASLGVLAAYTELAGDFERLFIQQGGDFERFYAQAAVIGALPKAQRHATLRAIP